MTVDKDLQDLVEFLGAKRPEVGVISMRPCLQQPML